MINKNILSTVISTSDWGAITSAVNACGNSLTDQTKLVATRALAGAAERLRVDIAASNEDGACIPEEIDPLAYVVSMETELYDKLAKEMEGGWNNEISQGNGIFMADVGHLRRVNGYNNAPDELFKARDVILDIIEGSKDLTTEDGDPIALASVLNLLVLSMCVPAGSIRESILKDATEV